MTPETRDYLECLKPLLHVKGHPTILIVDIAKIGETFEAAVKAIIQKDLEGRLEPVRQLIRKMEPTND